MSDPSASQNQSNELQDISVSGSSNTITFAPVQNTTIATQILQISAQEITQRELIWRSPYQGLRRFNTRDRDRFFGRDKLIQTILEAINSNQLTLVTGASGSGKSSAVRAGAIPELRKSLGNQPFDDFVFTPGENPFASLYRCLLNEEKDYQFSESEAKIALEPEAGTLPQVVEQLKPPQSRWLWFIDQFEELFTNCREEQVRQQFLQGLATVIAHADDSLRVVLGMRADFQEYFSYYQDWSQLINQNSYLFVGEMNPEELRQAIEQPAAQHGVVFEEGLVKQIIDDVQGQKGYLPLLQYTLDLLWKQECETKNQRGEAHIEDRVLNWQTYRDLQGVRGALKTQVEQIYQQMSWKQQEATKFILLKFVTIVPSESGDRVVSRKAHRDEFTQGTTRDTLQQLINNNLLVSSWEYEVGETSSSVSPGMAADSARQQGAIVELAHEILLVSWDRLKQWIEQEKEAIALKNFLTDETQRWQRVREERGAEAAREELLQGTRLEQIQDLRQAGAFEQVGGLQEIENEFVDASLADRERKAKQARRRRRNAIASLSVFSGVALTLASVAGWQWQKAEKARIDNRARTAQVLYFSGEKIEGLIESLAAYQELQKHFAPLANTFLPTRSIAQFMHPSQPEIVNSSTLRHEKKVNRVAFSPDGQFIASASDDSTVKLWNRQGQHQYTFAHEAPVTHIAFPSNMAGSPDSEIMMASASADGKIKIWNHQGERLYVLDAHEGKVNRIAFAPDGKLIASASDDSTVKLWDRQGNLRYTLDQHADAVTHIAFHPEAQILVSASSDSTVKVWRWNRQKQLLHDFNQHNGKVNRVAFSPDGQLIASASNDGTVRLWNRQGDVVKEPLEHAERVNYVAFSSDGKLIASASDDNTAKLWNRQGELVDTLEHEGNVNHVTFSADGKLIASASDDSTVKLWNRQGNLLHAFKHESLVQYVSFSPDGETIASASRDGMVELWTRQGQPLRFLRHEKPEPENGEDGWVDSIAFSPNSEIIASASRDNTVRVWNRQGDLLHTLSHEENVRHVAFSPDGETMASASSDGTVKLWNLQGNLLRTIQHDKFVNHVAFSPDSRMVASASSDGTVKLWDRQDKVLRILKHQGSVEHVTFDPKGTAIASASEDSTIKLWDLQGQLQHTLDQHESRVNHVAFGPDGNAIASASVDKTVRLWNRQGQLLHTLDEHEAWVAHVTFSPDGQLIASASDDNTVRLWNRQGELLNTLEHEGEVRGEGKVNYVAFSPDGNTIASASDDNTVRLWDRQGRFLYDFQHEADVRSVAFTKDKDGTSIASASADGIVRWWQRWTVGEDLVREGCQWLQNYVRPQRWENLRVCQPSSFPSSPPSNSSLHK